MLGMQMYPLLTSMRAYDGLSLLSRFLRNNIVMQRFTI